MSYDPKPYNAGRLPSFRETYAREFEWAAKHLPDEQPGVVAIALNMLKRAGQPTTKSAVLARLEAQGRTRAQLEENR